MAYNPFRAFRKHQKAMFAGLTILCMVTFVLTGSISAGWDFFQGLLPGSGKNGPDVATIYGKPVYDHELRLLAQQRDFANTFIRVAISRASDKSITAALKALADSPIDKQVLQQVEQVASFRLSPQFATYFQFFFPQLVQLREAQAAMQKPQEAAVIQQVENGLFRLYDLMRRPPQEFFFGGSRDPKELIDFLIWKHQADRLGIQIQGADLDALLARTTGRGLTNEDTGVIFKDIRQRYPSLSRDNLRHALGEEFRIRLAKEALVGPGSSNPEIAQADPVTPYEFWKFYRENRTESEILMLGIPVDRPDLLAKVGTPSEAELKKLFEANKEREYDPSSPEPGFKQPERIEIEWVAARPDAPKYQAGAKIVSAAIQATLPLVHQAALSQVYDVEKFKYSNPSWMSYGPGWRDENLNRAENVAGLLGQLASPVGGLSGAVSMPGLASARELQDRSTRVAGLILSAAPMQALGVLAPAYAGTPTSEYLPLERVKDRMSERVVEDLARDLSKDSLNQVRDYLRGGDQTKTEEVRKFLAVTAAVCQALATGATPELISLAPTAYSTYETAAEQLFRQKTAYESMLANAAGSPFAAAAVLYGQENLGIMLVRARLAELIQKLGLEHGSTTRPRDRFDIEEDKGIAPLKEAFQNHPRAPRTGKKQEFATQFFTRGSQSKVYDAQQLAGADQYLYWRSAEQPAYVPTFDEARKRVEAWWKFEKARPLAKEEADKLAAEARKAKGDPERNLEDAAKRFGNLIRLDHVAKLVPQNQAVASRYTPGKQFEPYQVPQSDVEYPSSGFVDKLLALKDRGDVAVLNDRPEANYYVAALLHRSEPYELAFYADAAQPDSLLANFDRETHYQQDYRQGCIEQLRQEADLKYNDENLKAWYKGSGTGVADEE